MLDILNLFKYLILNIINRKQS